MKTRTAQRACYLLAGWSGCKPAAACGMAAVQANRDGRVVFSFGSPCPLSSNSGRPSASISGPDAIRHEGPASVLLGSYGSATSAIEAPSPINYLAVRLKDGERWRYQPPAGHTVLWVAVGAGAVTVSDELRHGDLAAFDPSNEAIGFEAQSDAEFVVGSAVPHDHDLILGYHSVHTSADALREAAARISAIQARLMQEGRL